MVMAVLYMRDSWKVEHPNDPDFEEDEDVYRSPKKGYWSFASSN
jgi:hypothetical protein